MKIRQIVFVVSVVLTVSSQATANVSPSVQGTARPYFAGQSPTISTPASWTNFVYFENLTERGTIIPAGTDSADPYWPVAERYETLGIGEARSALSSAMVGVFLSDGVNLHLERSPNLIFGISDMTSVLLQQVFVAGAGLKNVVTPGGATRVFLGINDGWQWSNNIGELNLAVNPVPAPIAIVIGSIGVGFIGWTRIYKTYTV